MNISSFQLALLFWLGLSLVMFPFLFRIVAPFGRHTSGNFGPMLSNRLGWIIMESPALWWFGGLFLMGESEKSICVWIFFGLWMLHYIHRTLIFPFRTRTKGKQMPVVVAASAFGFQLVNGFFNGYFLGNYSEGYGEDWLTDPRMIGGLVLFALGMYINLRSDQMLLNLRGKNETHYSLPRGFLFRYVSCPNFFGELLEWTGFALMCWNLPALSFAIWTFANLLPRAWAHHRWYLENFPDYPKERKAVIPFFF